MVSVIAPFTKFSKVVGSWYGIFSETRAHMAQVSKENKDNKQAPKERYSHAVCFSTLFAIICVCKRNEVYIVTSAITRGCILKSFYFLV